MLTTDGLRGLTNVIFYLVAQLYRTGVGLATNAVVISTGGSVLTLSLALLLLDVQARQALASGGQADDL